MGVDFSCTIAGGTTNRDYVAALSKAIRAAGLESRFSFPGNLGREELKDLFGRSNVLVFPTEFEEPFGISQVEAMAAGMIVVGTATGGAAEVVEHEVTGLVFPKGDFAALAEALASLPRDGERWTRLAE